MRNGRFHVGFLVGLLLSIVLIVFITQWWGMIFESAQGDVTDIQTCSGMLGALAGGEGVCHDDSSCESRPPHLGTQWIPVGTGFGCDGRFCCVEVPDDKDLESGRCDLPPGSIVLYNTTSKTCLSPDSPRGWIREGGRFVIRYYKYAEEPDSCTADAQVQQPGGEFVFNGPLQGFDCKTGKRFSEAEYDTLNKLLGRKTGGASTGKSAAIEGGARVTFRVKEDDYVSTETFRVKVGK